MAKTTSADNVQKVSTPPVFSPVVIRVPAEEFKITDAQFDELQHAGAITLSEIQRTKLVTLALFWINDLRMRLSARPKQFRDCFDKMETAFLRAEAACRWDGGLNYHLVHWAKAQPVKEAEVFPVALAALENHLTTVRETVTALKHRLPPDPGRQRPFDDERRIIFLADIFQEAGGKPTAYLSEYAEAGSMADTPFRNFAQYFYLLLPADDKRDSGGLDKALRLALKARRAQRRVKPR